LSAFAAKPARTAITGLFHKIDTRLSDKRCSGVTMVIQLPGPLKGASFVSSDSHGLEQQFREIAAWMNTSKSAPAQPDRVYAIFDRGHVVREWNLMQNDGRAHIEP
jgi:hypothetical protein